MIPRIMRFDSLGVPAKIDNGDLPTKAARVEIPPSQYFSDGKRLVDYVLAYEEDEDDDEGSEDDSQPTSSVTTSNDKGAKKAAKKFNKRYIFESNLQKLGLELEYAAAKVGFYRQP